MSATIGKERMIRLGCHPVAVYANRERSEALWLWAAHLYEYRERTWYSPDGYEGWLDIFCLQPEPDPWWFDPLSKNAHTLKEEISDELQSRDAVTLERWLRYARRRLPVVERYATFLYLLNEIDSQKLLTVYERDKRGESVRRAS